MKAFCRWVGMPFRAFVGVCGLVFVLLCAFGNGWDATDSLVVDEIVSWIWLK